MNFCEECDNPRGHLPGCSRQPKGICGAVEASCVCINTNCDGIHVCQCEGSWSRGAHGFRIHAMPGGDW